MITEHTTEIRVRYQETDGQGRVQQSGLGGMFRMVVNCPACAGRGQVVKEFCEACRGKGRQPKKRKLSVRIPPGISDGLLGALKFSRWTVSAGQSPCAIVWIATMNGRGPHRYRCAPFCRFCSMPRSFNCTASGASPW